MEQCLSANPDINVVYTINEPAGEGAHAALKADNREDKAFIVSIDGSCQGMEDVENGIFAADATQYPGKMAKLGVDAVAKIGDGRAAPVTAEGQGLPRHRHQPRDREAPRRDQEPDRRRGPGALLGHGRQ